MKTISDLEKRSVTDKYGVYIYVCVIHKCVYVCIDIYISVCDIYLYQLSSLRLL